MSNSQGDESTHVFAGYPLLLQKATTSSSFGTVSRRRLSRDLLASFNVSASPTLHQLHELHVELNHQCLQQAVATEAGSLQKVTADVNSVVDIAIALSGTLSHARYPGTFLFQEIQLRALISSLALLHYHGVETLHPELWDKLNRTNISELQRRIAFQKRATLSEEVRHAPNVYLVQLASQYLSFIRRGDSNIPAVVGPIVKILFGSVSVAGGQYGNIQQILDGLTELVTLWQRPQTKYRALCTLQEYTRIATSLHRESSNPANSNDVKKATAMIVTALLEKIGAIVECESTPFPPKLGGQWPKTRLLMPFGHPNLDHGYYFLGLLDCTAQLAALTSLQMLPPGVIREMKSLIFNSVHPEYRWKAMEVFLSCDLGAKHSRILQAQVEEKSEPSFRKTNLDAFGVIKEHLEHEGKEGLRISVDEFSESSLNASSSASGSINVAGPSGDATPTKATQPSIAHLSDRDSWHESELPRSKVRASTVFATRFTRKVMFGSADWDFAGLSNDCRNVFFFNKARITVYHIGDLDASCLSPNFTKTFDLDLNKDIEHRGCILNAVLSQTYLVIVTTEHMLIISMVDEYRSESIAHGKWDPSGLACDERSSVLMILLGQCRGRLSKGFEGQIKVYTCTRESRRRNLTRHSEIPIPGRDGPKRIALNANMRFITCITRAENKVLTWQLDDDLELSKESYAFVKNRYTTEGFETGVTSVSLYTSPSQRSYVLCTTAPSTERWRNQGEWPFSLPLPDHFAPNSRPPEDAIHNFEQFKGLAALRTGTASGRHHIFAVLDEAGRLSLLPLAANGIGGVEGCESGAVTLVEKLEKQQRVLGCCLRFDEKGERLFAVDIRGRVVVVEFESEEN